MKLNRKIVLLIFVFVMMISIVSNDVFAYYYKSGGSYYSSNSYSTGNYSYSTNNSYSYNNYRYSYNNNNNNTTKNNNEKDTTVVDNDDQDTDTVKNGSDISNKVLEPNPGSQPVFEDHSQMEIQMLSLINQKRKSKGLQPLVMDNHLVNLARKKSRDMIRNNYFSHSSPTYGSPFKMLNDAGVRYRTAGENIAGNSSVASAYRALMNSSGHRKNILNSDFTKIGIGIVEGGPYGMMFTQIFTG